MKKKSFWNMNSPSTLLLRVTHTRMEITYSLWSMRISHNCLSTDSSQQNNWPIHLIFKVSIIFPTNFMTVLWVRANALKIHWHTCFYIVLQSPTTRNSGLGRNCSSYIYVFSKSSTRKRIPISKLDHNSFW